jgi:hypothetical protein
MSTVDQYRFTACAFAQATHYRHMREAAIFPIADLNVRHAGDCVLPLRLEYVQVPA